METNAGNEIRQATMLLNQALAHINFEAARTKGNVSTESGTSSRGETGIGPQG